MSIFFVVGKPGGGKSYYGVKQIMDELGASDRYIVTNVELNLPEIRKLLHDEGHDGMEELDLAERIRILDESETSEFWNYEPGRDFKLRKNIERRGTPITVPDFEDRAKRGCLYVIDEVHTMFGAREWQGTGPDCTFFLSQHRKLRCDVILITQHPEQVDKALRRLAQDYVQMRNLSREPVMGFHVGSVFRWSRSLNSPTSANVRVFESGFLKLDVSRYGKLYDTMSGVGIQGRVTPTQEVKGRSKFWLIPPVLLGLFLIFMGPRMLGHLGSGITKKYIGSFFGKAAFHGHDPKTNALPAEPDSSPVHEVQKRLFPVPVNRSIQRSRDPVDPQDPVSPTAADSEPVVMTSRCILNGKYYVFLSDGRSFTSDDNLLESVSQRGCRYDGHWYPWDTSRHVFMHSDEKKPGMELRGATSPKSLTFDGERQSAVSSPPSYADVLSTRRLVINIGGETIVKPVPERPQGDSNVEVETIGQAPELGLERPSRGFLGSAYQNSVQSGEITVQR